jgi:colanic acid biosynthesis glycosyl transferase WcaI
MTEPSRDVLMITQYYWPELIGSGPYCTELAESLADAGWQVRVFTSRPHYPEGVVPESYRDGGRDREGHNGVTIERVDPWRPERRGALGRMAGELIFLMRGLAALASGRIGRSPQVVSLCPSLLAVLLGRIACRRGGRHVVMRAAERWVLNGVDIVFVLSGQMRDRLRQQGVTVPIEVLPIWVDADRIQPVERPAEGPAIVLYSGNLGRKQALDQVLGLAEILQRRGSEVRVVIRGQGGEARRLNEEAVRRALSNVEFRPLLPADRLSEGLAEGDVHLVPQDGNAADYAVPSKIYGIMAAGRPFVATARPGSHLWRLQEETGAFLCVPPGDPDALANAVLVLGMDARKRAALGARGRAFVQAHHEKAAVLELFEATLRRLA